MPKKSPLIKAATKPARPGAAGLLAEMRGLILAAREQVARTVYSGPVTLCWHIAPAQDWLSRRVPIASGHAS